jgi:hypothetical protein
MIDPIIWPIQLRPEQTSVNPVPFTRSGGKTINGIQRSTKTDRGYWTIGYKNVPVYNVNLRRLWNAIRTEAGGRAGLLAVPAWSPETNDWPIGSYLGLIKTVHSDGTPHSDTTPYLQDPIQVNMLNAAEIGDTVVILQLFGGIDDLTGIRFSYQHALYETGIASISGNLYTVRIFPSIRAPIPAGAQLQVSRPTCLVHLMSDKEMDTIMSAGSFFDQMDVSFVEAVDEWNDRATA